MGFDPRHEIETADETCPEMAFQTGLETGFETGCCLEKTRVRARTPSLQLKFL